MFLGIASPVGGKTTGLGFYSGGRGDAVHEPAEPGGRIFGFVAGEVNADVEEDLQGDEYGEEEAGLVVKGHGRQADEDGELEDDDASGGMFGHAADPREGALLEGGEIDEEREEEQGGDSGKAKTQMFRLEGGGFHALDGWQEDHEQSEDEEALNGEEGQHDGEVVGEEAVGPGFRGGGVCAAIDGEPGRGTEVSGFSGKDAVKEDPEADEEGHEDAFAPVDRHDSAFRPGSAEPAEGGDGVKAEEGH